MEHRLLGRSGCAVSCLGLGAMTLGAEVDQDASMAILDAFAEAGGTLIDTADVYGGTSAQPARGRSEEVIGAWWSSRPRDMTDRMVVATKARFRTDLSANGVGLSARHLHRAVDASLRRLGVDTIDLYQAHAFDPLTPLEETLRVFDALIASGKIRYYGLSNFTGWQLTKAVLLARHLGFAEPVTIQVQHNLLTRAVEWETVPAALDAGLGVLPWSPLAGGWLAGKYARASLPPPGSRFADDRNRALQPFETREDDETTWRVLEAVRRVAAERGERPASVALAWLLGRPGVSSVLIGVRRLDQLAELLPSSAALLTADQTAALDEASRPANPGQPYDDGARWQRSRSLEDVLTGTSRTGTRPARTTQERL